MCVCAHHAQIHSHALIDSRHGLSVMHVCTRNIHSQICTRALIWCAIKNSTENSCRYVRICLRRFGRTWGMLLYVYTHTDVFVYFKTVHICMCCKNDKAIYCYVYLSTHGYVTRHLCWCVCVWSTHLHTYKTCSNIRIVVHQILCTCINLLVCMYVQTYTHTHIHTYLHTYMRKHKTMFQA